jgi:hypothetical protein
MSTKDDGAGSGETTVRPYAQDDEHPYTYASTQATNCAGCGEFRHTPLRIDAMGGYVCLTCIDRKLGVLLGEFGYAAPQQPLDFDQLQRVMSRHFGGCELTDDEEDSAEAFARAVEREHGIGA